MEATVTFVSEVSAEEISDCDSNSIEPQRKSRNKDVCMQDNEVLHHNLGGAFSVNELSPNRFAAFVKCLSFDDVADTISRECIDAECFLSMEEDDLIDLGMDLAAVSDIKMSLRKHKQTPLLTSLSLPLPSSPEAADKNLICYGRLIVLGYKECRLSSGKPPQPIGSPNETFDLTQRVTPNCKLVSRVSVPPAAPPCSPTLCCVAEAPTLSLSYTTDDNFDMFQIGRCSKGSNDVIVRGPLHCDTHTGAKTGPVSRYAARIMCERNAPHRCYLYAGGFDCNNEISLSGYTPLWLSSKRCDILPATRIRLYTPSTRTWSDISIQGVAYCSTMTTTPLSITNELEPGSVIDIGGSLLKFQAPTNLPCIPPEEILRTIHLQRPQCPVLMTSLFFAGTGGRTWERLIREQERGYELRSMQEEMRDSCDQSVPYVFPTCGHVFGYSKELVGRSCPLCRQKGPFVALQFPFQPHLCGDIPTHVFSPCGHAASQKTCSEWSKLRMPVLSDSAYESAPICPFCATKLDTDPNGDGVFKKLIIHFEKQDESSITVCIRNSTADSDEAATATDSGPPSAKKSKTYLRHKIMNLFKHR